MSIVGTGPSASTLGPVNAKNPGTAVAVPGVDAGQPDQNAAT